MYDRSRVVLVLSAAFVLLLSTSAAAAAVDPLPTTMEAARQLYEGAVADWAKGPVQYLLTGDEKDMWKGLTTDAERVAFKRWFWDRRDPDLRTQGNEFQDVFYTRVAQANDRFRGGLFSGWESDRGRAWVLLGHPDGMQPNLGLRYESQDWTYYTVGRDRSFETVFGEFHILFVRSDPAKGFEVWDPFAGIGVWPRSVLDAFDYTRNAYVVNPDLEKPAELHPMDETAH